jgi:hypothetical protein
VLTPWQSRLQSWEGIIAEIVFAVLLCYGFKQLQLSGVTDKYAPSSRLCLSVGDGGHTRGMPRSKC